ncbi:putative Tetratricopeptide repeat [Trypanosoma vivax]|uniref:Putative conserved TPR domain protein n=1 Tax=Trypanosoma vivax (strain Y486) TaxID=1055687 RepID=G0TX66_TRYVY|nr:hypothetical protein TRVL_00643 [Trypanosoma vivax]KAH8613528.1 putative Tetratricopeptide repeat [Trypanosoma vivax]CCC48556.1 putative conserved TPR domain protein [Trypanosoma vivax Y486]
MDSVLTDVPTVLHPVTEDHKKLVFSFIHAIRSLQTSTPGRVETIVQMLSEEYGVDPAGVGGLNDAGVNLLEVFTNALRDASKSASSQNSEKFNSFLELLVKKGYFGDTEPGSEEYNSRLEKAKKKFEKWNNPYDGMTAEEIKNKGNELMGVAKYKEAVACYTKAIEMDPEKHIFFSNRAAAHIHLKDYGSAVLDCERAIAISPSYSKAYSRLGTAFFYQENYDRAVQAFTKALELDPDNERYKEDLRQAEGKVKHSGGVSTGPGDTGGFPLAPGCMPGFSQVAQMMNNPQFIEATTRMMENPQFTQMIANFASRMSGVGAGGDPEEMMRSMGSLMGPGEVDADGNVVTPFGKINHEALERLKREEIERNPKFRAIIEDMEQNRFSAFQKYIGDPDVMEFILKFQRAIMNGASS